MTGVQTCALPIFLVRAGDDFVGVGKVGADGDVLFGFLPKERRRKERMS